jgi:hypothetical protein
MQRFSGQRATGGHTFSMVCRQVEARVLTVTPFAGSMPGMTTNDDRVVISACCGHGLEDGYIMFADNRTIRFRLLSDGARPRVDDRPRHGPLRR